MESPFKSPGLREFAVKTALFVVLSLTVSVLISIFLKQTLIYKTYLEISNVFTIEKPNIRTTLINAFLVGLVAFLVTTYKKLVCIKSFKFSKNQIGFIIVAVLTLISHYVFNYYVNAYTSYFMQNVIFWSIVKFSFNVFFVIFLGLGIFGLNFIRYFLKEYKREILIFAAVSIGFFFLMLTFQNLWTIFSSTITQVLYWFFKIFYNDVGYSLSSSNGPMLRLMSFSATIGKPCSGIDSLLLFTTLYLLIISLDYKRLKKPLTILFYFIGAAGMFLTNIIRIFLLFLVGVYISPTFAVGMFHTNIGWILFLIYFFIFYAIARKIIYKKEDSPKKE